LDVLGEDHFGLHACTWRIRPDGRLMVSRPLESSLTFSGTPLPAATAPVSCTVPTRRPLTRTSSVAEPGTRSWVGACVGVLRGFVFWQPVMLSSRRPPLPWGVDVVFVFVFVLEELVLFTVVVIGAATQVIGALTVVVVTVIT